MTKPRMQWPGLPSGDITSRIDQLALARVQADAYHAKMLHDNGGNEVPVDYQSIQFAVAKEDRHTTIDLDAYRPREKDARILITTSDCVMYSYLVKQMKRHPSQWDIEDIRWNSNKTKALFITLSAPTDFLKIKGRDVKDDED